MTEMATELREETTANSEALRGLIRHPVCLPETLVQLVAVLQTSSGQRLTKGSLRLDRATALRKRLQGRRPFQQTWVPREALREAHRTHAAGLRYTFRLRLFGGAA